MYHIYKVVKADSNSKTTTHTTTASNLTKGQANEVVKSSGGKAVLMGVVYNKKALLEQGN